MPRLLQTLLYLTLTAASAQAEPSLERLQTVASFQKALEPTARPHLVHFWALWCPPCVEELPRQVELARSARAAGVEVLWVNLDGFTKEAAVRSHLRSLKGAGASRNVQLDPAISPENLSKQLAPGWTGALPATFGLPADGTPVVAVLEPITSEGAKRMLTALTPRLTPHPEKSP